MVPKHKAITRHNGAKRLLSRKVQAAGRSILVFFFFPISPPLLWFYESHSCSFITAASGISCTSQTSLFWYCKRLGFWVNSSDLFKAANKANQKCSLPSLPSCPSVYPRGWFNTARASEVFKVWFCLLVCLLLCPAPWGLWFAINKLIYFSAKPHTMQQSSPVKLTVHKQQTIFGLIATEASARWIPSLSVKLRRWSALRSIKAGGKQNVVLSFLLERGAR